MILIEWNMRNACKNDKVHLHLDYLVLDIPAVKILEDADTHHHDHCALQHSIFYILDANRRNTLSARIIADAEGYKPHSSSWIHDRGTRFQATTATQCESSISPLTSMYSLMIRHISNGCRI